MRPPTARWACVLLLAAAAPSALAFLPADGLAREAIDELPSVQAAAERAREAGARGDALRSNPYGAELTVMPLARHTRGAGTYGEVEAMLMQRMRLPGKSRLDGALAEAGDRIAQYMLGDARHEGARQLLAAWVTWVRAAHLVALAERQRTTLADERRAVARSVELGELPLLDERRAAAALAQADLAVERARMAREQARLAFVTDFPGLPLPATPPEVPTPSSTPVDTDAVERMLAHSHELLMARALAARQGVAAARADAERRPDPSIGLRVLSEGDGGDQGLGVVLTIPFAASGQRATVRAESALGAALETEAAGIERRVRREATGLVQALPAQREAWSAAVRMLDAAEDALNRVDKAWRLGAVGLDELLRARRQAYEARLNEVDLRLDVAALVARIEIDTHRRWAAADGDADEAPEVTLSAAGSAAGD